MSASFHMAQRTGVILSGDYSAPELKGISKWPPGTYGIRDDGSVILKTTTGYKFWQYPDYTERPASDVEGYIVGYRSDFAKAKEVGQQYVVKNGPGTKDYLLVEKGTWNDGAYTYVVKSATEVYVPETGKTFTPSSETWAKFVKQMNSAKLKDGKAPAKSSGGGSSYLPSTVVAPVPAETSAPFYKAKWFLPAVAGGTVLLVLAIALWPKKKKDSAPVVYLPAPAPVPVPAPVAAPLLPPQVI